MGEITNRREISTIVDAGSLGTASAANKLILQVASWLGELRPSMYGQARTTRRARYNDSIDAAWQSGFDVLKPSASELERERSFMASPWNSTVMAFTSGARLMGTRM
jgi:hypothetical protein